MKDSSDPRWIGAWWLGFLGSSVAAIFTAFPILMFARQLPEAQKHRRKDGIFKKKKFLITCFFVCYKKFN